MKNGLILAALGCLVLGGLVGWALYARSEAPPPAPANPTNHAASSGNGAARPSEPLAVEPQAKHETPAPEPRPVAQPAAPAAPAPLHITDFLPYPNGGETDFKLKYAGLDLEELTHAKNSLQVLLNEETRRAAEESFAAGKYDEILIDPRNPGSNQKEIKPPEGQGEVLSVERTSLEPDGKIRNQTAWVTQAAHPEIFAHQSEYAFLSNAWKQAGGR